MTWRRSFAVIAARNPQAARRIRNLIQACVRPAAVHPQLYRRSERVPGMRGIVAHPNCIVLHRVAGGCIEVVDVLHARRGFSGQGF